MGDRAMAELRTKEGSLYFYTHWYGESLPKIAREALEGARARVGDEPYALRRIIDSLIRDTESRDQETGSGISLGKNFEDEYNNDEPSVVIDLIDWEVLTFRKGN